MIKKILLGISISLLGSTLLLLFVVFVLVATIRPNTIKQWGTESGVYSTVTDNLLDAAKQKENANQEDISLQNPIVQNAIKQTINPVFLQNSAETIVDGTFSWLDGSSAQPTFNIDLVPVKESLADNIAISAKERFLSLPACAPKTLPKTSDPLTIDCRPTAPFNIDSELAKLKSEITNSKDFLPKTTITASSIAEENKPSPFETNQELPRVYQKAQLAPIVLLLFVVALAAAVVLLSASKVSGFRRVGVTLLLAAFLAGGILAVLNVVIQKLSDEFLKNVGGTAGFKESIVKFWQLADKTVTSAGVKIVAIYGGLGLALVIAVSIYNRKNAKATATKPTPTTAKS